MKWIFRLFGILILVVIVTVGALFFLPGEKIAEIAADRISKMTGRKVELSGKTKISFYPVLGISTGAVTIANADWSDAGPMLTAKSLKVGVDATVLFGGEIKITGLEVVEPQVLLELSKTGEVNWELGVEGVSTVTSTVEDEPATSSALALTLDRALIKGATVRYVDRGTGNEIVLKNSDFDLRWPAYQGDATFTAVLRPTGSEINITGQLDNVGNFIAGGVSDMQAKIKAPGGSMSFIGRGGFQPQLSGHISADLNNTGKFMAALGLSAVEIPKGLGQAVAMQANLTVTPDLRVSLRDVVLQLDHNKLTGAADITLGGDRPKVNAQLRAGALDLPAVASGNSEDGSGSAASVGWSKTPIDASALSLADGEVALVADSLDLGTFKFGKTRILASNDRSRAVFSLRELAGYGGVVTGQFVANNRNGLSVGGDMKISGIDMQAFLTAAAGISRFSATGNAAFDFLGVGQSVDAIMKSLNGNASVNTGRGHISGFDLDKLMRSGNGTGGTTVFDKMSSTFTIKSGNMYNDDLLMLLPLAKATGEGRIGLGVQDIDYMFTPVLLEGSNFRGLAIPVRITGPWANPRIRPDLEKAIEMNLKEEKRKLKARAKEEITGILERQLGLEPQDGQAGDGTTEAQPNGSLEDTITDGLLKLLQ
jgi:AsmA protein